MFKSVDSIVEVNGLGKVQARRPAVTRKRFAGDFTRALLNLKSLATDKLRPGEFWSLKDVNFSLKRGEALGVIGLNGAGKTTLLRILAGQILPDAGEVYMQGSIVSMIDLTAGFQMSASGRRNIFLRGAMLGRTPEEMQATFDQIVDFAELGDAIDAPVSTYSSGMQMRLAFSIMISVCPDILLIDEILAVGDFQFRQKCLAHIRSMRENSAFVFVSHSMGTITDFCDKVIVLNKGEVVFQGDPKEAVEIYESLKFPESGTPEVKKANILKPQFFNENAIEEVEHFWCDVDGNPITKIMAGEDLYFKASFRVKHKPRNFFMGVPLWTEEGVYVTGFSTQLQDDSFDITPGSKNDFILRIPSLVLNPGFYIGNLSISDGPEILYRQELSALEVLQHKTRFWGAVTLPHRWELVAGADSGSYSSSDQKTA
jgi:ABC-type polysaccharide/polyol phosphate transport system ATPase subunit